MIRSAVMLSLMIASPALAESTKCLVRAIKATQGGEKAEIDDVLAPLKKLLSRAPLSTFSKFELLAEESVGTDAGKPAVVTLPNKKKLTLTNLGRVALKKGNTVRSLLRLRVDYPGISTTYKVGRGAAIPLVLGPHGGGKLLLAIQCD